MGLLTTVTRVFDGDADGSNVAATLDSEPTHRARCRNCGRYYGAETEACPYCGSGNRLLGGPPGRTDARCRD